MTEQTYRALFVIGSAVIMLALVAIPTVMMLILN
jgi:hypothetical protein